MAIVITVSIASLSAVLYGVRANSSYRLRRLAVLECENIISCLRSADPDEAFSLCYGFDKDELSFTELITVKNDARENFCISFPEGYFDGDSRAVLGGDAYGDVNISFVLEISKGRVFVVDVCAVSRKLTGEGGYAEAYSLKLPLLLH